jgi:arsenical pump membrane protein
VAASIACGTFIVGLVAGVSIYLMATVCAAALILAFAAWQRHQLRWQLLPWRLLVFVTGLFLVVDTVGRYGLSQWLTTLIGTDPGAAGVARAATTGATLSNVLNNLPVYVAGEAVVPSGNHDQLLGLLIGTNVGPLIAPWASLATLLWAQRCRAAGVSIHWGRFVAAGAVTALLACAAGVGALLVVA